MFQETRVILITVRRKQEVNSGLLCEGPGFCWSGPSWPLTSEDALTFLIMSHDFLLRSWWTRVQEVLLKRLVLLIFTGLPNTRLLHWIYTDVSKCELFLTRFGPFPWLIKLSGGCKEHVLMFLWLRLLWVLRENTWRWFKVTTTGGWIKSHQIWEDTCGFVFVVSDSWFYLPELQLVLLGIRTARLRVQYIDFAASCRSQYWDFFN